MSSSPTDAVVEVIMPALGSSVVEGTVLAWHKRVGDAVAADEALCDVATDKVDSEIPSPCAGRLAAIAVEPGRTVPVGTVIATIAGDGAAAAAATRAAPEAGAGAGVEADAAERHSPVVARLAAEHGVDLATVAGTGAGGRIRKEDVLAAIGTASAGSGGPGGYAPPPPVELSRMRRLIGAHMKRSLDTAATVTSWIEVDFTAVERRRRELGTTALPVVAAATVATLAQYGELNAWLDGDRVTRHDDVNLGIAVSLGADGLIVPVVRSAQRLAAGELAARISALVERARAGALSADDVEAGTFTLTNPGRFGTVMATPVISQPQVAILDMEAIVRRPVVVDGPAGEEIAIRPICVLGLSWDHRALDGAYAAQFLGALRGRLEQGAA